MKKVMLSFVFIALFSILFNKVVLAENLSYPFESITIVEAKKFDILIPSTITTESLLFGKVESGEVVTVFIATIVMKEIGSTDEHSSYVLIIADDEELDIVRYLINNFYQDPGVIMEFGFASHILIDSTMGVYKDMSLIDHMQQITIRHVIAGDVITLIDNTGLQIPMIENTYELRTNLEIVISVNTPEAEVTP
jgi:hypothetical protein